MWISLICNLSVICTYFRADQERTRRRRVSTSITALFCVHVRIIFTIEGTGVFFHFREGKEYSKYYSIFCVHVRIILTIEGTGVFFHFREEEDSEDEDEEENQENGESNEKKPDEGTSQDYPMARYINISVLLHCEKDW